MVIGAKLLSHEPRVFDIRAGAIHLDVFGVLHRECLERLADVPRGDGRNDARVQTAAQQRSKGHVAHQLQTDGVVQQGTGTGGVLVHRLSVVIRTADRDVPVLPHFRCPALDYHRVARRQGCDVPEHGAIPHELRAE
jgi:hypothetical protein